MESFLFIIMLYADAVLANLDLWKNITCNVNFPNVDEEHVKVRHSDLRLVPLSHTREA